MNGAKTMGIRKTKTTWAATVLAAGLLATSWDSGAIVDKGNMRYGLLYSGRINLVVRYALIPATTLRDALVYENVYAYDLQLGVGNTTVKYAGLISSNLKQDCVRRLSGVISPSCTDEWNRQTGADWRCWGLIKHMDSWKAGTGYAVVEGDRVAMNEYINRALVKGTIKVEAIDPTGGGYWPPGRHTQSFSVNNNNEDVIWNPNSGQDIKGVWCAMRIYAAL